MVSFFRAFRTFVRWANGLSKDYRIDAITSNNPFDKFSIGAEQYGTPYYLTMDERNHLADAEPLRDLHDKETYSSSNV